MLGWRRFLLPKTRKRPTIVFVDMEIMRTLASAFTRSVTCVFLSASTVFASDIVLQKVPAAETAPATKSNLSSQASFALINYNVRTQARALYVSSGTDLAAANKMIDDQAATSFGFMPTDNSPVAIIDLGKVSTLRRISAVYSPRATAIDFYVLQSLPGVDGDNSASLTLDEKAVAKLKSVGSAIDDGTQGRAAIDFPATSGRYVMLRWTPAARSDTGFTVAEVSAFSPSRGNLLASNRNFSNTETGDSKDVADSKDVGESKDLPEVAPAPPEEGPPPPLTPPPPFTFIPQLSPQSD
jgi:hypothetical protein